MAAGLRKVENCRHLPVTSDSNSGVGPELGHADVIRSSAKTQVMTSRPRDDGIVDPDTADDCR